MILRRISKTSTKQFFDSVIFSDFTAVGNGENHTFSVTEQPRRAYKPEKSKFQKSLSRGFRYTPKDLKKNLKTAFKVKMFNIWIFWPR